MLPRSLVAAILINLSIYIVAGAEDIINVIGGGIQSLMLAPFSGINGAASGVGGTSAIHVSGVTGVLGTLGLGGIAIAAGFTEGIAGILLFCSRYLYPGSYRSPNNHNDQARFYWLYYC